MNRITRPIQIRITLTVLALAIALVAAWPGPASAQNIATRRRATPTTDTRTTRFVRQATATPRTTRFVRRYPTPTPQQSRGGAH